MEVLKDKDCTINTPVVLGVQDSPWIIKRILMISFVVQNRVCALMINKRCIQSKLVNSQLMTSLWMIGNIQLVHSMVQMVVHVKKGGEVMNKNKFVSVMKLHGDTQESLAEAIGLSVQRMNAKINSTGGAEFTMSEIRAIKIRYGLKSEEIDDIFFCD